MINPTLAAQIFSKLGNSSSLLPMIVKDSAHSAGMTTSSYVAGKEIEGKDRFIDEIGAEAIWVGGIPFYKKAIDLTLYKIAKHNAKIDTRVLKEEKVWKMAIKHAPTPEVAQSIQKAAKNITTFKGLALAKFIAATALTLGSYAALTVFRHKHTEKNIIKQIKKEELQKKEAAFEGEQAKKKAQAGAKPSFGMNLGGLKDFMFDPVKNMMIVDGGITAERLAESRNPQDFMGYVIKEGSFWAFMYFAGPAIQKYFEKRSNTKQNKAIDLDIRALQDKELHDAFKNNTVEEQVKEMKAILKIEKTETIGKNGKKVVTEKILNPEELYEFICKEENNLVVKMAKKAGVIPTYKTKNEGNNIVDKITNVFKKSKDTGMVDTQQFIDLDEVKGVGEKLETLYNQSKAALTKGENAESVEEFLAKTVKLKQGSILKNIGTCMGVLGVVVPGIMLAQRLMKKDNKEFAVKKEIHEKLKNQNLLA